MSNSNGLAVNIIVYKLCTVNKYKVEYLLSRTRTLRFERRDFLTKIPKFVSKTENPFTVRKQKYIYIKHKGTLLRASVRPVVSLLLSLIHLFHLPTILHQNGKFDRETNIFSCLRINDLPSLTTRPDYLILVFVHMCLQREPSTTGWTSLGTN